MHKALTIFIIAAWSYNIMFHFPGGVIGRINNKPSIGNNGRAVIIDTVINGQPYWMVINNVYQNKSK